MSRLEVEHQGFKIFYAENSDTWQCFMLGVEEKTLSKAKAKVNERIRDALKTMDLQMALLDYSGIRKVQIVGRDSKSGKFWVVSEDSGRRRLESLHNMRPWSEEIERVVTRVTALHAEATKLYTEAREVQKTIQPLDAKEIDSLISTLVKRFDADQ